jgi:hypothetical protein
MTFLLDFRWLHLYVAEEAYELLLKHKQISNKGLKGNDNDYYSAKIYC